MRLVLGHLPAETQTDAQLLLQPIREATKIRHHVVLTVLFLPHAELEGFALDWAKEIVSKSPTAIRMLKYAMNMVDDGLVGQQIFAGEATRLGYMTDEAAEGRDAFLEKRPKDFKKFPWHF